MTNPSIAAQNGSQHELTADFVGSVLENLIECLEQENRALDSLKVSEIEPIVDRKEALFEQYGVIFEGIEANPSFKQNLKDDERERLRGLTGRFEELLVENAVRLDAAQHVTDTVLNAYDEAVKAEGTGRISTYGNTGKVRDDLPILQSGMTPTAPLSLDRSI